VSTITSYKRRGNERGDAQSQVGYISSCLAAEPYGPISAKNSKIIGSGGSTICQRGGADQGEPIRGRGPGAEPLVGVRGGEAPLKLKC